MWRFLGLDFVLCGMLCPSGLGLERLCPFWRALLLYGFLSAGGGPVPLDPMFLDLRFGVVAWSPLRHRRGSAALRTEIYLPGDRVVLGTTRSRRRKLLQQLQTWLWQTKGISLAFLLQEKPSDPEKISQWLVAYGRELFRTGKAYGIYAETLNSVAAARPQLRKQLTQAWDLAFLDRRRALRS